MFFRGRRWGWQDGNVAVTHKPMKLVLVEVDDNEFKDLMDIVSREFLAVDVVRHRDVHANAIIYNICSCIRKMHITFRYPHSYLYHVFTNCIYAIIKYDYYSLSAY